MSQSSNGPSPAGGVSPELDALSCDLLGSALDALAAGTDVLAVVAVEDASSHRLVRSLADDAPDACIEAARALVRSLVAAGGDPAEGLAAPERYALVYEGAVEEGTGAYADALILEFGERGRPAFSAYVLWDGFGAGDAFAWADPEPAGEVASLLRP